MSAAAAPAAGDAPPPKGGKKKLILIIVAVVLLLAAGGGGFFYFKAKAAHEAEAAAEEEGAEEAPAKHAEKKPPKREKKKDDKHTPPVFVPLDHFTVNLADRDQDRFAQIGITLEVVDAKAGDEIKAYLPAIRNNILLLLSSKSAADLATAEGKEKLARQVRREAVLPMGIELEDEDEPVEEPQPGKKRKRRAYDSLADSPVQQVHFSAFIIQ